MNELIEYLNDNPGVVVLTYASGTFLVALVASWAVLEQRRLRKAQFRPVVTADMELNSERGAAFFVLENVGTATARGVEIEIDPPLTNPTNPSLSITPELHPWLSRGLSVMVPGKQIRTLMAIFGDYPLDGQPRHKVAIEYKASGRWWKFREEFEIDMESFRTVKQSDPLGLHTIANELAQQTKVMGRSATSLREIATHLLGLEEE